MACPARLRCRGCRGGSRCRHRPRRHCRAQRARNSGLHVSWCGGQRCPGRVVLRHQAGTVSESITLGSWSTLVHYGVDGYGVLYRTIAVDGSPTTASGLVVLPRGGGGSLSFVNRVQLVGTAPASRCRARAPSLRAGAHWPPRLTPSGGPLAAAWHRHRPGCQLGRQAAACSRRISGCRLPTGR